MARGRSGAGLPGSRAVLRVALGSPITGSLGAVRIDWRLGCSDLIVHRRPRPAALCCCRQQQFQKDRLPGAPTGASGLCAVRRHPARRPRRPCPTKSPARFTVHGNQRRTSLDGLATTTEQDKPVCGDWRHGRAGRRDRPDKRATAAGSATGAGATAGSGAENDACAPPHTQPHHTTGGSRGPGKTIVTMQTHQLLCAFIDIE